jgi:uncharacterized protein Yka (UPF0111/DUF47 family)
MRIRDIILPEDKIFFTLFKEMTERISEASSTLNEITHELPNGTEKSHKVRQLEHKCDEITRHVFEHLNESLITPLEPEEISRLAPVMDDVMDRIDRVTQQICNYELAESNDTLKEFSYLIMLSATEITEAVTALESLKKPDDVKSHATEINRIYNLSIELQAKAVLDLLIIKLKDIYEGLGRVMEKCNDVGHALNDIAMSHA